MAAVLQPGVPRAFKLVVAVQFLSTLADNAFLIIAIARVQELAGPQWLTPVLKISLTLFYVLLAPFVGALADHWPKGRVMLFANALKLVALTMLPIGLNPVIAIGLVGFGSAVYAPAKYGLITELLPACKLVLANSYFESVTVCGVLLGVVLGGLLVSPVMTQWGPWDAVSVASPDSTALLPGMLVVLLMNVVAFFMSFGIADSGARYERHSFHPAVLLVRFFRECGVLWRDPLGRLTLSVTTLLWGVGATLQLLVLRWAHDALQLPLSQSSYLQGVTALGVVGGALLASRWVVLGQTPRLLPFGILIGLLLPLLLLAKSTWSAAVLLALVGALAGFFVVPMNALLQQRGGSLLTAGRSIAVQGFHENAGMLLMLALYAVATALNISLASLVFGFALLVAGTIGLIWARQAP